MGATRRLDAPPGMPFKDARRDVLGAWGDVTDELAETDAVADEPNWFDVIADFSSEAWYRTATVRRLSTSARERRWRVVDDSTDDLAIASALVATGFEGFAIHVAVIVEAAIRPTTNACALRLEMTPTAGGPSVLADAIASPWSGLLSASGDMRGYTACVSKVPGGWMLEVLGEAFDTGLMECVAHFWPSVGVEGALFDPASTGEVIIRAPMVTLMTLEQATERRYAMYEAVGTGQ